MSQISLEEIVVASEASARPSHSPAAIPNIVPVPRGSVELKRNQTIEEFQIAKASESQGQPSGSPLASQVRRSIDQVAGVTAAGVGLSHRISVEIQSRSSVQIRQSIDQRQQKLQNMQQHANASVPQQSHSQVHDELRQINAAKKFAGIIAHTYSFQELASILHTDLINGLTVQDSKTRFQRDGPNRLTPPVQTPWWVKLIKQLIGGFQLMLIGAAILCWVVGNLSNPIDQQTNFLGYVLVIVVVVTGVFAFFQEAKSDKVMEVNVLYFYSIISFL
jgi:hypothetical protein